MTRTLKLFFKNTEDGLNTLVIRNPKEELDMDEVKTAMEAIVASGAFADLTAVHRGVLYSSEVEIIYEA